MPLPIEALNCWGRRSLSSIVSDASQPPPAPPLTPPDVTEDVYTGLAEVVQEGTAFTNGTWENNVCLAVEMVDPQGQLVRLEFQTSKVNTRYLFLYDVISVEFTANGGVLELVDYQLVWSSLGAYGLLIQATSD